MNGAVYSGNYRPPALPGRGAGDGGPRKFPLWDLVNLVRSTRKTGEPETDGGRRFMPLGGDKFNEGLSSERTPTKKLKRDQRSITVLSGCRHQRRLEHPNLYYTDDARMPIKKWKLRKKSVYAEYGTEMRNVLNFDATESAPFGIDPVLKNTTDDLNSNAYGFTMV